MIHYLRHIAIFARVAEEGSFSEAARSLGIAPSRVSESVSKLEQFAGTTLINRTTRKIALTSEGRRLYAHTSGILKEAERGLNELRETNSSPKGTLRISVPSYLSSSPLAQAISQFIAINSQVHIAAEFTDHNVDAVKHGYDMCIRAGRFDRHNATTRKFGSFERVVVVGKQYLAGKNLPENPNDLLDWDWINYRHSKRLIVLKSDAGDTLKLSIQNQARLEVDNIDALYSFACMDLGVAVMPIEFAQRGIREEKLVRLLDTWHLPKVQYFAVWPDKSHRESLISIFVDFLAKSLKGEVQ